MAVLYDFQVMNPGASTAIWPEPTDWLLNRYADKPGALEITMSGEHGIANRAIVDAYLVSEEGADSYSMPVFRGYVLPPDEYTDDDVRIKIPAIENILFSRFAPTVRYPAGTTLAKMLTHDWPASSSEKPGLLCLAAHMVQPGEFVLLTGNVWKLPEGGTSYLGSIHGLGDHVYIDSVQQTWGSSTSLSAGQYWQDATYLYIYYPNSATKNPSNSIILVEGVYETNIRLGSKYTLPSTTFTKSWRVAEGSNIYKEIIKLLNSFNLQYEFIYFTNGITYLDANATIGRSASLTEYPTYKYDKCTIKKLRRRTTAGSIPVHALRGAGIGKGPTKQFFTAASHPAGLRFVSRAEYSSQFRDQLTGTVNQLFADAQDTDCYMVEAEPDPAAKPYDYVKVVPENSNSSIQQIAQITQKAGGLMKLYLGHRMKDAEDVLREKADFQETLQRDLDLQYTDISVSGQENVDSNNPCKIILQVKEADWDDELGSLWTANIGIKAFESTITQVSTAEGNHGSGGTETTTGDGGAHSDHDLADAGDSNDYSSGGTLRWCTNVTDIQEDAGGGDHIHNDDFNYGGYVTGDDHVHAFAPNKNPGANAEFALDTYSNPGQIAGKALGKELAAALGGTDSWVAYLTVTVKIINATYPSGQEVSGSPFYDVAMNEDLPDIDVSTLIVPGENTVQISIARYGTPGPGETDFVKARANVSVTGKFVVDIS